MLRMSIHGVRMFTEPVFYRGRHGQESEEGKEDREGSHQEGGKEDFKEKEVVVSATERLPRAVATRTQSETSPKDLKCPLQPLGSRQGKIRPDLCAGGYCIKVRFFVSAPIPTYADGGRLKGQSATCRTSIANEKINKDNEFARD
jgi:hypothetical protein